MKTPPLKCSKSIRDLEKGYMIDIYTDDPDLCQGLWVLIKQSIANKHAPAASETHHPDTH